MGISSFGHLLLPTENIGVSEPPIEASLVLDSPHFSPSTPQRRSAFSLLSGSFLLGLPHAFITSQPDAQRQEDV